MRPIRNFLFHRVSKTRDDLWDPMDIDLFEMAIGYINRKYHVVRLEELSTAILSKQKKPLASICFDDGYKDNFTNALPILEKHNIKASFYVVTDCITNNTLTWTHQLEYAFQHTNQTALPIDFSFLEPEFHVTKLLSKEERLAYVRKLKPRLKQLGAAQREAVLKMVQDSFNDVVFPKMMMDWEDIRQLYSLGHSIGSHTVSHNMLGTMENEEDIRYELEESGNVLKNEIGEFPYTISYPVGSYNKRVMELSKELGYKIGLAVKQDVYRPGKDNLFEIPRIELYNEPWWKTRLRITNHLEQAKKLIFYR